MSVTSNTSTETDEIESDANKTASVNTTADGEVLGSCLFLGEDDLEALGVSDADTVAYSVENGGLRVAGVGSE